MVDAEHLVHPLLNVLKENNVIPKNSNPFSPIQLQDDLSHHVYGVLLLQMTCEICLLHTGQNIEFHFMFSRYFILYYCGYVKNILGVRRENIRLETAPAAWLADR